MSSEAQPEPVAEHGHRVAGVLVVAARVGVMSGRGIGVGRGGMSRLLRHAGSGVVVVALVHVRVLRGLAATVDGGGRLGNHRRLWTAAAP